MCHPNTFKGAHQDENDSNSSKENENIIGQLKKPKGLNGNMRQKTYAENHRPHKNKRKNEKTKC